MVTEDSDAIACRLERVASDLFMTPWGNRVRFFEREKQAGTMLVDMNSQGAVIACKGAGNAIGTFGLAGCAAVAAILESPVNRIQRTAIVAHYGTLAIRMGMYHLLGALLRQHWAEGLEARAWIMVPGHWHKDATGKYGMVPKDDRMVGLLTAVLCSSVPSLQEIAVRGYSEMMEFGNHEKGTLLMRLPGDAKDQVQVFIEGMPEPVTSGAPAPTARLGFPDRLRAAAPSESPTARSRTSGRGDGKPGPTMSL
jgi:hypothetical protein